MALVSAATLEGAFESGDTPTSADFKNLLDSFQHKVSAAGTADRIRALGAADLGVDLVQAGTTASAQRHIGAGTLGIELVEVGGTASAQGHMGAGAVGIEMLEAAGTASAQGHIGGGTAGIALYEAETTASVNSQIAGVEQATTAQAAGGSALGVYMSPQLVENSPFAARAYLTFSCAAAVLESKRVSGVTKNGTGDFTITWAPALPTTRYAFAPGAYRQGDDSNVAIIAQAAASSPPTVSALRMEYRTQAGAVTDPKDAATITVFCSGV